MFRDTIQMTGIWAVAWEDKGVSLGLRGVSEAIIGSGRRIYPFQ